MKKYVITGGASSGKSSLITALEIKGEFVIKESAESIARYMNAIGIKNPHTQKSYQPKVLDLFLKREKIILKNNPKRIFYDRGIHDQLDYTKINGFEIFKELQEQINKVKYDKIFFLESLNKLQQTEYRKETNLEECNKMGEMHYNTYKHFGFKIIKVPNLELERRVGFILNKL